MQMQSAIALRDEIIDEGLSNTARTVAALPAAAHVTASALPSGRPPSPIALGIVGRKNNYRLAIRVLRATPGLQSQIEEIRDRAKGEIDIRQVGRLVKQATRWHQRKNRPSRIGGSIGHVDITAGTLGCFVKKTTGSGGDFILSNNHVLANENLASRGDAILQPGPDDDGDDPQDRVGVLDKFVPLKRRNNLVDAAIATIEEGLEYYYDELKSIGTIRGVRTTPLEEDEVVFKVGRTTGKTKGLVKAIEMSDLVIEYDMGDIVFNEQIEIAPAEDEPFSLGGDSGSLIVDADRNAVALLFGGNDVDATYANPIGAVLKALKIELVH
jgi:hypothetical protein